MHIERVSLSPPPGVAELLADLGGGENGFVGTPVHAGEFTLDQYLQHCCDQADGRNLQPGLVPQTVYWILDDDGYAVGLVRMRHYLNESLLRAGGHIGFYVRKDRRGRGYATQALRAVLVELRSKGASRALLTVDSDNLASIHVVEAVGGQQADASSGPDEGRQHLRFWISLDPIVG